MKKLVALWSAYSARILSIVLAVAAAGFIPGATGKLIGVILPLLGGQAVHSTVFAPATVVSKVTEAATSTAAQLTADIAGVPGQILPAAQGVVDGVITGVLGAK